MPEPAEEKDDLDAFSAGDYARANKFALTLRAISTILVSNDSGEHGRILRLKQEYLFVSAGLQTVRAYRISTVRIGTTLQITSASTLNTHPAMCGG